MTLYNFTISYHHFAKKTCQSISTNITYSPCTGFLYPYPPPCYSSFKLTYDYQSITPPLFKLLLG